jgi:hypothetical protein
MARILKNPDGKVLKAENNWAEFSDTQYITSIGNTSWLNFIHQTAKFTIEWDFVRKTNTSMIHFGNNYNYALGGFFILSTVNSTTSFRLCNNSGALQIAINFDVAGNLLQIGTPYKLKVVGDGNNLYAYVNNALVSTVAITSALSTTDAQYALIIARVQTVYPFIGNMRNIKIWNENTLVYSAPLVDRDNINRNLVTGLNSGVITGVNVVNKLETERWLHIPETSQISFGNTSTFAFMNDGVFRMEFDFRLLKSTNTNSAQIYTGTGTGSRGFMFYLRTDNRLYLYWMTAVGSYPRLLTPSANVFGVSYHYTLMGDGTNIRLIIDNNDTGVNFYDSSWLSCAYVPFETVSNPLRIGTTTLTPNFQLKNIKVWTDTDGNNLMFDLPCQEERYDIDKQGGLVGVRNVANQFRLTNSNQNIMKSENLWGYFDGIDNFASFGTSSTWGWMNDGIFRIEMEYIPLSTKVSNSHIMSTGHATTSRGFRLYQDTNGISFYYRNGDGALINPIILVTNDRVIGTVYRIHIWSDGSKVYYTTYVDGQIHKQDLIGTPYTYITNATTSVALSVATYGSSVNGTYNTECYVRNIRIYKSSDRSQPFYYIPFQQKVNMDKEIYSGSLGTNRRMSVVDLG